MNGKHRRVFVSDGLMWPNGLSLDLVNQELYWCDGYTNNIERIGLSGTNRKVGQNVTKSDYSKKYSKKKSKYSKKYLKKIEIFQNWNIPTAYEIFQKIFFKKSKYSKKYLKKKSKYSKKYLKKKIEIFQKIFEKKIEIFQNWNIPTAYEIFQKIFEKKIKIFQLFTK